MILDIGELTNTIVVFGGPYSNLQATQAMKQYCERNNIPPSNVICTGDIVAYCAQPQETNDLIRAWGIHVVQGNCEFSLGNDEADCGCGFEENTECDIASKQWFSYSRTRLDEETKSWMRSLPTQINFQVGKKHFACLHGSDNAQNEFVFESNSNKAKLEQIERLNVDVIIGGHCGLPFGQALTQDKYWLNAGVIGMPANDGKRHTWFMKIEQKAGTEASSLSADWHPLHYDADIAQKSMLIQSLNRGYAEALQSGYWPNMDVLPLKEQGNKGKALSLIPMEIN